MNRSDLPALPPNSPEDERGLLGSLMASPKCLAEFIADFSGDEGAFYDGRHSVIFRAIRELVEARLPLDPIAVERRLASAGRLPDAGGEAYVREIANGPGNEWSVPTFAPAVRECHLRRRAIQAAAEIARIAREGTADEAAEAAERELGAIATARSAVTDTGIRGAVVELIEDWQAQQAGKRKPGLATGLGMLDVRLRGVKPGQLIVIAGRPGDGKTSLAMQIAEHVAVDCRTPVGVFSLEMTRAELAGRMIAGRAGVSIEEATARHDESEAAAQRSKRLAAAAAAVSKSPLHVSDKCGLTVSGIRAQARLWSQRHGIALLILDYIGLVRSTNPKASAYERVSEISVALKALAKEIAVPVVALSQLNRSSKREDRAPDLHDLRDSGSVEQDSDIVLMLHPDKPEDTSERPKFSVLIRKHRHGRRCEIPVLFNRALTRFGHDI